MIFYEFVNHEWLMKFVERCIADPRMLRLILKWLRTGVSEDGDWSKTEVGAPQGSVAFVKRHLPALCSLRVRRIRHEPIPVQGKWL